MSLYRVYLDTSAIGGCHDDEFAFDSVRLVNAIKDGKLIALFSQIVLKELEEAPETVRRILLSLPPGNVERVDITEEVEHLRDRSEEHTSELQSRLHLV